MQKKVIVIIILGIALRLIHLPQLFHFTYDEEIIAFIGKRIFLNQHLPLIGGVTPMHVHVGPYYYWLSGFILLLSNFNPIGWGIAAAGIAGITMWMLFQVGQTFFNKRVGLLAVFLYAVSFYQNIFDRHYWGLVLNGLITLTVLFSLIHVLRGQKKYAWVLGLALTFGFHTDPSTLVLFLLVGFLFLLTVFKKVPKQYNQTAILQAVPIIGIIFFFSLVPLIIFDVRHNFSNSRGILLYIEELKVGKRGIIQTTPQDAFLFVPRALARTLYVFGSTDLAQQYAYCPRYASQRLRQVPLLFIVAIIALFAYLLYRFRKNVEMQFPLGLLLLLFFSTYVGITLYGLMAKGDLFDHYLSTLFPIFLLLVAYGTLSLVKNRRVLLIILLVGFTFTNVYQLITVKHRFGYADKTAAVAWAITQTGEDPFALDVIGDCFRYNGYRYLFYLAGKEPTKSYVDANFTHLYDRPPEKEHPRQLVVLTNPDLEESSTYKQEYEGYLKKTVARQQFGNIEVLVVDNSNLDFVGKF